MALILMVDDDPDVVAVCRLLLEKAGHEVIAASNVDDGKRLVRERDPALMILDVMMEQPDDGIAMAREIRRQGNDRPILMLTAISQVTGMEFAGDDDVVPVDEFVSKPIDSATLVATVENLLER